MSIEVGSYDAKTKLPELLREVQAGRRFTITLRGKPVADLVPSEQDKRADPGEAIAAMRAFPRVQGVAAADVEDWIAEGRR
ncbi:type II toxin-antitoxin system Phd/YefM family antitoxin [uncultured Thiohalocapsa sp.]|uniref:type II toxin-antitoxin system Phd/YefM family antitoxin n=1 Tax=uncultured Thiohalocapsa sp. TaxID=768990 RepID=UPI0025D449C8|nr:type II toxin-antitoxin system prevent-host-death family antitoxin [uncultured Thiohalocapsa sp.]